MLRLLLALSCLLVACGPSPDPTFLITKARVLGVRYAVDGDPARTRPAPGETISGEFIITQPAAAMPNGWAFIFCTPAPINFGFAFCEGEPFGFSIQSEAVDEVPRFEVQVPEDLAGDLLVIGGLCLGGDASLELDPEGADEGDINPCVGEGIGQLISGVIPVVRESRDENAPPQIGELRFDGTPWVADPPAERAGCAGGTLPTVGLEDGIVHELEVEAVAGSREPFMEERAGELVADIEQLPVAFYATTRGLDNLFSVIDADPGDSARDATPIATNEFRTADIESAIDPTGTVVKFEIVMRDDRGGVDHVTRAICVTP